MKNPGKGWELAVERGPDWVFVRLIPPEDQAQEDPELAERLWDVLLRHLTHRIVLELDEVPLLRSHVIGQLAKLAKRVLSHGGMLRITGLSPNNQEVLRLCRLDQMFPNFPNREQAVAGSR
jgi:anti-anti-sigma factor